MSVNTILKQMRQAGRLQDIRAKGDLGEDAALAVVHSYYNKKGCLLYKGFTYKYASDKRSKSYIGNVFLQQDGSYTAISEKSLSDEIDILYISNYRIFPIEIKSYHAKLDLTVKYLKKNGVIQYGVSGHKNPIWQSEKHARHLYHRLYDVIPDGEPRYIQPIVCFTDRCELHDERSDEHKFYLPCVILNTLKQCLCDFDVPQKYRLNIAEIEKKLEKIKKG
ncbi:MAG: NERD domain-containing protein [Endomicrobium sp.]|jgi:hypothetical protein|nr:NERD domain-containing protein [Endomicrobium sp.]